MNPRTWIWIAYLFVFFQMGLGIWHSVTAMELRADSPHRASVGDVYKHTGMVLCISGLVTAKLLFVLGLQDQRIQRLEQQIGAQAPQGTPSNASPGEPPPS